MTAPVDREIFIRAIESAWAGDIRAEIAAVDQQEANPRSSPARGILLGLIGGGAMWAGIIAAVLHSG